MHKSSHSLLGKYLAATYMSEIPQHYVNAFLFGCIQPDRNPTTYIKGSLRFQMFRGHNYRNSSKYMGLLASRLSAKHRLQFLDFYDLGKLIHYAADAFTYPHNDFFEKSLAYHRKYEQILHEYLTEYLPDYTPIQHASSFDIKQMITNKHKEYVLSARDPQTDCTFILNVCCNILMILLQDKYSSFTDGPNVLGVAVESN